MKNFKGTPGPWEVIEHSWSDTSLVSGDKTIATVSIYEEATEENQEEIESEVSANFRLISKAPEMLEMIEQLSENLALQLGRLGCCGEGDGKDHRADSDSYGGNELLLQARELIKQATEL